MTTINPSILEAALEGLQIQKNRLEIQIAAVRAQLDGSPVPARRLVAKATATPAEPKLKRKLSATGRKAIAEAARRRWALARKAKAEKPATEATLKAAAKKTVKKRAAKAAKAVATKTARKAGKTATVKKGAAKGTKKSAAKRIKTAETASVES